MRRIGAFVLILAVLMSFSVCAHATVDLSALRSSDLFDITVNGEQNFAIINSAMSEELRSFHHKYENDYLYSSTRFSVGILDYYGDSIPMLSLVINYTADEFLYINGVTFIIDGKNYTFSKVADSDSLHTLDNGKGEVLIINFGMENAGFIGALAGYCVDAGLDDDIENAKKASITMILHGKEDVTATLDVGFFLDWLIMSRGFTAIDGLDYLSEITATPMKVH
ncbi:MAG: hypothetical protein K6C12_13140 [Oscillospiraceae bacterium]|nr:hypothetical protein [Oscillospiraceae bacterium]